ncbi:MAG: hypothetical protein QM796_05380 [Chthoniobacteraceae bacterium]
MKQFRLLLLCAIATGFAACEKHPYSDLEKLEKNEQKKTEGAAPKQGAYQPVAQHPLVVASI